MSAERAPFEDRLIAFLEPLRAQGFRVGIGEIVAVQQVVATVRAEGWDGAPEDLAGWIAPIVCGSQENQARFGAIYSAWCARDRGDAPAPPRPPAIEIELGRRWALWLLLACVGVVGICVALVAFRKEPAIAPPDGGRRVVVRRPSGGTPTPTPAPVHVDSDQRLTALGWSRGFGRRELAGHEADVVAMAFSPDSSRIVTVSYDGAAFLWDGEGNRIAALTTSEDTEGADLIGWLDGRFSADSQRILTISPAGVQAWDRDGTPLRVLMSGMPEAYRIEVSPDFSTILTWGTLGLDIARNVQVTRVDLQGETCSTARFAPDGSRFVVLTDSGRAMVFSIEGRSLGEVGEPPMTGAMFHPSGDLVVWSATGVQRGPMTAEGAELASIWKGKASEVAVSPDGTHVVILSDGGSVVVDGEEERSIPYSEHVEATADGRGFVTQEILSQEDSRLESDSSSFVSGWDWRSDHRWRVSATWGCVVTSPDSRSLLWADTDGPPTLVSTEANAPEVLWTNKGMIFAAWASEQDRLIMASYDSLELSGRPWQSLDRGTFIHDAAIDRAGSTIAAATSDTIGVWKLPHGPQDDPFAWMRNPRTEMEASILDGRVGLSPDGQMLAVGRDDGTAVIWSVAGTEVANLEAHPTTISSIVFFPDGSRILSASEDGTARKWQMDGTKDDADLHLGSGLLRATLSPDGDRILTACEDGTARIWSLDGRELAVLRGHDAPVLDAEFSRDGSRIVTASADFSAVVWRPHGADWEPERVLRGHTAPINTARFHPDGDRIVTASDDETVRTWDVAPNRHARAPWVAALIVGLLFAGLIPLLRRLFSRVALRRRDVSPDAAFASLKAKGVSLTAADPALRSQAVRLRRRTECAPVAGDIDIERSIDRTIQSGGFGRLVLRARRRAPEDLVLVDRQSSRDHLAAAIDARLDKLEHEGVHLERASFVGQPGVVFRKGSAMSLADLHARFPGHRAWVFTDGRSGSASEASSSDWLEEVTAWEQRAVVFSEPPAPLSPMADRLASLGVRAATWLRPADSLDEGLPGPIPQGGRRLFPPSLSRAPQAWISPTAPERHRIDAMVGEVRDYLGDSGFRWLAACAVYPELHPPLTRELGRLVGPECETPEATLRLARLPWFRRGRMPDWLRRELLQHLPAPLERAVRERFLQLLSGKDRSGLFELSIAVDAKGPLKELWHELRRDAERNPQAPDALRDAVFVDWMEGDLGMVLRRGVVRALLQRAGNSAGQPVAPRPQGLAIACTLVVGLLLGASSLGIAWQAALAALHGVLLAAVHRVHLPTRPRLRLLLELGVQGVAVAAVARPDTDGLLLIALGILIGLAFFQLTARRPRGAGSLGWLADRLLLDRVLHWLVRDFSDRRPAASTEPGRQWPRAPLVTALVMGTVTAAAWTSERRRGWAHEWEWAAAGALITAYLIAVMLAESKHEVRWSPMRCFVELVAGCAGAFLATSWIGSTPVSWPVAASTAAGVGALGAAAVATIAWLRRRRHPLHGWIAPLQAMGALVAVDLIMERAGKALAESEDEVRE